MSEWVVSLCDVMADVQESLVSATVATRLSKCWSGQDSVNGTIMRSDNRPDFFPVSQRGGLPGPVQVAPVVLSRYFRAIVWPLWRDFFAKFPLGLAHSSPPSLTL